MSQNDQAFAMLLFVSLSLFLSAYGVLQWANFSVETSCQPDVLRPRADIPRR